MTIMEPAPSAGRHALASTPIARRTPRAVVHGASSRYRGEVEAFIAAAFAKHFGARIRTFMPLLFALHDDLGKPVAAVGYRDAGSHRLFLEQYTRKPVEVLLSERLGIAVSRDHVVEVGNLACSGARSAFAIVRDLIPFLIHAGYRWVVFTAADTVLGVFRRMRLEPYPLCPADRSMLEREHDDWGAYYDHAPVVMAGRLLDGLRAAAALPARRA